MRKNTKNGSKKSKSASKSHLKISLIIFAVLVTLGIIGIVAYNLLWKPNINTEGGKYKSFYVLQGDTWDDVKVKLDSMGLIKHDLEFTNAVSVFAKDEMPQCGFYSLEPNISNRSFINRLSYGLSNKMPVEIKMTRYTRWVARNISRQVAADSASLYRAFMADSTLHKFGVTRESSLAMFVRFKREVNWCIDADEMVNIVYDEYNKFWNDDRRAKCYEIGLTPIQATILASIVEEETNDYDDRRMVAGVYMNRMRRGMPLQSCPTVRYAWENFSIKRVLKAHLEIDSPYNTYKYQGLPPGPIRIPSERAIDAVLNYVHHNYYYMCAKSDFSGVHDYATTFQEHSNNARRYQRQLNKRGIK